MSLSKITKVTIKLNKNVNRAFSENMQHLSLRKNSYVTSLLSNELPKLRANYSSNSNEVYEHLKRRSSLAPARERVTLSLDHKVAYELREFCDEYRIVRDSLFNRMFFYLVSGSEFFISEEEAIERLENDYDGQLQQNYKEVLADLIANQPGMQPPLIFANSIINEPFELARSLGIDIYSYTPRIENTFESCFLNEQQLRLETENFDFSFLQPNPSLDF